MPATPDYPQRHCLVDYSISVRAACEPMPNLDRASDSVRLRHDRPAHAAATGKTRDPWHVNSYPNQPSPRP
jgi:hypothetical protein